MASDPSELDLQTWWLCAKSSSKFGVARKHSEFSKRLTSVLEFWSPLKIHM